MTTSAAGANHLTAASDMISLHAKMRTKKLEATRKVEGSPARKLKRHGLTLRSARLLAVAGRLVFFILLAPTRHTARLSGRALGFGP